MTETAHTAYEVEENLRAAGCDEAEVRAIMESWQNGDLAGIGRLVAACRKKQLAQLHTAQTCIDRLDYLSWRLEKMGTGS